MDVAGSVMDFTSKIPTGYGAALLAAWVGVVAKELKETPVE